MSVLLAALLAAAPVSATAPKADANWLPWLGCWTLVQDHVREPLTGEETPSESDALPLGGLVCMTPDDGGVRVTSYSDDEMFLEETLHADGTRQPASAGQCVGWQQLDWSTDAHRVFTRSLLTCDDGHDRLVSGVSLFTDARTWVEIQAIASGGSRTVVVRRYRPARQEDTLPKSGLSEEVLERAAQARGDVAGMMSIDDVIEAKGYVAPATLEAILMEHKKGFDLDSDALLRLDDAGVPPSLIDVMVALSYPEKFQVERASAPTALTWTTGYTYPYYYVPFGYSYGYAPYDPVYVVRPWPGAIVGRVTDNGGYAVISRRNPSTYSSGSSAGGYRGDRSGSEGSSGASGRGYHRGGAQSRGTARHKN